jgi:hypothetical protein
MVVLVDEVSITLMLEVEVLLALVLGAVPALLVEVLSSRLVPVAAVTTEPDDVALGATLALDPLESAVVA